MVEPGGSDDFVSSPQQVDARRTSNNPAYLRELEPELGGELLGVDCGSRYYYLVFLARICSLRRRNAVHVGNALDIDLDADLARRRDVGEIGNQPVGDVYRRRRAAPSQPDRGLNSGDGVGEARAVSLARLLSGEPCPHRGGGTAELSGDVDPLPGFSARARQRVLDRAQRGDG